MKMTLKKGTPLLLCCSFIKLRDLQEAVGSLSSSEIEKKKTSDDVLTVLQLNTGFFFFFFFFFFYLFTAYL